jgi:2-formylbenzoate dehydrogenase
MSAPTAFPPGPPSLPPGPPTLPPGPPSLPPGPPTLPPAPPTLQAAQPAPPAAGEPPAADRPWRLLIGGEHVAAASGEYFDDENPADLSVVARVPDAGPADVDRAVSAAVAAAPGWARVPARQRGAIVREMAARLLAHAGELAVLDALDAGLPVTAMRTDVTWAVELMTLFADWAMELKGDTVPASSEHLHFTERRPYGVVARIIPYNHPLFFAAGKIAAPLVAGNAVVLKPADQAPLSALRMAEIIGDLVPPGVLNVVASSSVETGRALVRHPAVRRIGFIGSEPTGRAIQRDAADSGVKNVTLELGGKNAMIILPDADLDRAAASAVAGMNFAVSAGQSCGSTSRLLLHEDIAAGVLERVAELARAVRVGLPIRPETQMGPLSFRRQYEHVTRLVEAGRSEGATLVTGGVRPGGADLQRGYFLEPTVFAGVTPDMRIAREEIFGPVLSVMTYKTADEAVRLANSVDYGLTASVWTTSLKSAHLITRELDAGYVWVNGASRHFWGMPFGGVKSSGIGREESLEELLSYTQLKSVNVLLD